MNDVQEMMYKWSAIWDFTYRSWLYMQSKYDNMSF